MRTRKYAKLLAWLVPVVVAASWQGCSEGAVVDDDSDVPVPLQVGVSLHGEFPGTRSATEVESGLIGIFLPENKEAGYASRYNVEYANNGNGVWQPTDASNQIFLRKAPVTVTAFYDPEGLVTFQSDNSSVTQTQLIAQPYPAAQPEEAEKPWWYIASQEVSKSSPTARFALKPVYANVRLILTHHVGYAGSCAINNVSFSHGATGVICRSASFDVASGVIVTDETEDKSAAYFFNPEIEGIAVDKPDSSVSVLLPPQDIADGLTIALTIDGTERQITVPATEFNSNKFNMLESGKQYTIWLLIMDSEIIFTNSVVIIDYTVDESTITNDTPVEV